MPLLSGTDDCSGNSGDMSQNTKRVLVTAGGRGRGWGTEKKENLCTNCYRTIYWMDEKPEWVNLSILPVVSALLYVQKRKRATRKVVFFVFLKRYT